MLAADVYVFSPNPRNTVDTNAPASALLASAQTRWPPGGLLVQSDRLGKTVEAKLQNKRSYGYQTSRQLGGGQNDTRVEEKACLYIQIGLCQSLCQTVRWENAVMEHIPGIGPHSLFGNIKHKMRV